METVGGAALGVCFQEGTNMITGLASKCWKFKSTHRELASLVDRLTPMANKIKTSEENLDQPNEELVGLLEDAKGDVNEYSEVPGWKCCCFPFYQHKLQKKREELLKSATVVIPATTAMNVQKIQEQLTDDRGQKGQCKPPENPDITVGLDSPLNKLRKKLLKSGVKVHVLTGLAGSGKSTLARLLCYDEQIRGKFKENILYLPVSKTLDLKTIVQTVFGHCGEVVPTLLDNDQAVTQLRDLLNKIGESPMMLVLDNVCPGLESIIEAFKVELSDYKIVVTSRVEFPRFGTSCNLKPLSPDDAVTLFRRFALPSDSTRRSYIPVPDEELVQQVARGCWGSPLALKLIGKSLCGHPIEVWQKMEKLLSKGHAVVATNDDLLNHLQEFLVDALEDKAIIKECFMDLGLFPEDRKIPVAALIDMWTERTELNELDDGNKDDDGDIYAINNVYQLKDRHLVDLVVTREVTSHIDKYYNHHFLMQHDLLKEIAIHQAKKEPYEQRKRLIFDINEKSWPLQNQQNAVAHTLSISTDKTSTPDWSSNVTAEEIEVLVLNLRTNKYTLPDFMRNMSKLKVLIVTNHNAFHISELNNFEILGCLSSLKRIRLQQVSVPFIGRLNNLRKLSLYLCDTSKAFQSDTISISDALPNLVDLNIDYCKDMVGLPNGICDISPLKKLSITNCHKLSALPQGIGKLVNLELLRLSSCTDLEGIPDSIGRLINLRLLDVSNCISLPSLPEEIGNLSNLRTLCMTSCANCKLPFSDINLNNLNVICDEETAASWEDFESMIPNLKVQVPKVEVNLNWLHSMSA